MKRKLVVLAVGALGLTFQCAFVYALLSAGNVGGSFVLLAFGAIALTGLIAFLTRKPALAAAILLCGSIGAFATAYLRDRLRKIDEMLARANTARDVPCNAIHEHPPGRVVYLQDCAVRADLDGRAEHPRRRGGNDFVRVAPIVPPGWAPPDPVPAWAAFRTNKSTFGGYEESEGLAQWARPHRAGIVLAPDRYYEAAIDDAERRHGVISVFAPLVEWLDPQEERAARRDRFVLALVATLGVWLLAALGWMFQRQDTKSSITAA